MRQPDPWLTAHSWAEKTDITYPVELAGKEYTARLYKLAVTGYEGRTNTLNLFDLDTIDESIVHDGIAFDKTAIDKNLTLVPLPGRFRRGRPSAAGVPAVPDGLCRGPADPGRVRRPGLQLPRPGRLCRHPDQRHAPQHGHPGADPSAG